MNDRETKLEKLSALSFVLNEQNLYLDCYPKNKEALADFRKNAEEYRRLAAEYEAAYGALTARADAAGDSFRWAETNFPWQTEDM